MQGKTGSRPRGPSISGESMTTLFTDDPLMHGLALFGNGGQLGLLSHTPPNFTPGSYEVSHMKRARAGSISGRLRSASDLEEKGLIDKSQKGVLKDLIISGDSQLQTALDLYDNGDASQLEALMENGLLDRRESFDLLDNLDFGIMELGMSDEEPSSHSGAESAAVEPVPDGPDEHEAQAGSSKPTVPPPPLPTTASAATDKAAVMTGVKTRAFRNSGASEEGGPAPASSVGGGEKVSTQEGGDGVQGGGVAVRSIGGGGGPAGGGNGAQDSEHEVDLAGEGSGQFDIGEMAFDATFDHDYGEQEDDDVDMKDGSGQLPSSSSTRAAAADAAAAAAAVSTAVGPLRVVGSTSKTKLSTRVPPNDAERSEGGGGSHAGCSRETGPGVVMSDDEGGGREGHGDADAPGLGSFSTMGAVIGDFSPQFKFSFTDDIHLDLGGGLKDELRDLESFSEHGPDPHGRGGEMLALSASRAQQLLSRGGPAVVKSEVLSTSPSQLGATRSGTAAAAAAAASAKASAAGAGGSAVAAGGGGDGGTDSSSGFSTNHYASGADAAAGGEAAGAGPSSPVSVQTRPHGSSAAAIAAAAAAAGGFHVGGHGGTGGGGGHAAAGGVTPTPHAPRGRPVVSGMGIMVGGGPRVGMGAGGAGADGEKKFVGAYSPEARRQRIERFLDKREKRVWTKMVKYDVRKNFADTRMRVKGRFVKKEDEALLREVMACA
ncbi:conserved unknown protein [Ectocarpus siliculosus]|uniref:CCT domain-containing protein n=1 Tax=Ectocarpus siliculosus TaxID=2880 RepID=D8LRP7_ECTSI|nr:conserved unknown protein [Ectocarpus siliculosus]|eukprot:CBN77808.1 conserved unknown protein [Ectocarpus siliculosus]